MEEKKAKEEKKDAAAAEDLPGPSAVQEADLSWAEERMAQLKAGAAPPPLQLARDCCSWRIAVIVAGASPLLL